MADYYTLLTSLGAAKLANAHVTGTAVQLTELAIGDGLDGAAYAPSEDQTALENEVWRAGINDIRTGTDNPNWLVIEGVVPEASGGWYVREVGIFDADGDLFAIGKYPVTYKPALAEGSGKDLLIRMVLEISNAADVTLKIDPAIVLATRDYVDEEVADHNSDPDAHGGRPAYDVPFLAGFDAGFDGEDLEAGAIYGRVLIVRPVTVQGLLADLGLAATGADLTLDVEKNGASLFTTLPKFEAGSTAFSAGVLDAEAVDCVAGDILVFKTPQVGTTIAGQELTVGLIGREA